MKTLSVALIASAIGLAFVLASPAEAAKSSKHKKSTGVTHAKKYHRQAAVGVQELTGASRLPSFCGAVEL